MRYPKEFLFFFQKILFDLLACVNLKIVIHIFYLQQDFDNQIIAYITMKIKNI